MLYDTEKAHYNYIVKHFRKSSNLLKLLPCLTTTTTTTECREPVCNTPTAHTYSVLAAVPLVISITYTDITDYFVARKGAACTFTQSVHKRVFVLGMLTTATHATQQ